MLPLFFRPDSSLAGQGVESTGAAVQAVHLTEGGGQEGAVGEITHNHW